MKYVVPAAMTIGVGLVVLISYLFAIPGLVAIRTVLVDWAVILGGLAVLVGVLNLLLVNARRVQKAERGWVYSLVTMFTAAAALVAGIVESLQAGTPALYQPESLTGVLFSGVIMPSQAALAGLVMIFLVAAGARLLHRKPNVWTIVFLVALLIMLVGWIPLGGVRLLADLREWVLRVPASAGARGILLGTALGTLTIGLRVLIGVERPYKD